MSHLRLCKQTDGIAALTDLNVLLDMAAADPFPVTYQPYTEVVAPDNLGHAIKAGLPVAHWHWDWLPQPDIDILLGYEGEVYVRTEIQTGRIRTIATFQGYMQEPQVGDPILPDPSIPFAPQKRGPVDVDFINLIVQP